MKFNTEITWLNSPTALKLAIVWTVGIGAGNILIGFGKASSPYYMLPFALAALVLMFFTGVIVWRSWYPEEIDVFSLKGRGAGLLIFLGPLLLETTLAVPQLRPALWHYSGFMKLLWCVFAIGLLEELWWRGIWFAMWKNRPLICILVGSLAFGISHFQLHGFEKMVTAFFIGLVYAAARYRGTSIGVLALAHGFNDWIGQGHVIKWNWQVGNRAIDSALIVVCILLVAVILKTERIKKTL